MSISVIIPCYRAAATLRRAVDSALTGAPADLEVLLVDDGSPDDTGVLCDELAAADPRVRALHRANGGAGAARNTGLDAAHGDWVLFLDADDALLPGLWAALDALTTDADMILFGLTRESSGAVKPTDYLPAGFCPDLQALGSALSPLLFDTGLLAAPYPKLFRRAAIGAVRFDARLAINEDVLFNIQFLQNTSAIYCLDGVYYKQYDTEAGSLSRRLRGDLLDAERVTRPALADLLRQNGIDPAPYEAASRLRACLNQYGLLTGCKGTLSYAERRALFAEILADPAARKALRERLRNDPNRLLAVQKPHVLIKVKDTGCGIPADRQEMLFRWHMRPMTLDYVAGGVGLGLPLAHQIARLHGGQLLLNSREGQGTTATIALPMVRALGTLGENIEDYTGGFQRVLLELADALPDEAFLAKHLDE